VVQARDERFPLRQRLPDEVDNLGGVDQFAQTPLCEGPFGPNSMYCDTIVK
jgi:hypothetical protein